MDLPDGLFAKFEKILSSGLSSKKQFLEICRDSFHLNLLDQDVVIRDSTAWLKASPLVKNKIFTIKTALLEELQKQNSPIRDIRF